MQRVVRFVVVTVLLPSGWRMGDQSAGFNHKVGNSVAEDVSLGTCCDIFIFAGSCMLDGGFNDFCVIIRGL